LQFGNPYKASPGVALDDWLHSYFFANTSHKPLAYSTDEKAADKLRARMKSLYGHKVETGTTALREARHFARLESGPSTSTETLAPTYALAISRLALVVALRRDPEIQ
jgi:hypothetical protein